MRVLFVAPRYHSNQAELVRGLIRQGHSVRFWVVRTGASESYEDLVPERITYSRWILRLFTLIFGDGGRETVFSRALPDWKSIFHFFKSKFDVVVIRHPFSAMGMAFAFFARIQGSQIIFYTQEDLHRAKKPIRDALANVLKWVFSARWITPCLGDLGYSTPIKGMEYLPFSCDTRAPKKQWFNGERVNIIAVGKFVDRKNHMLLLEALDKLQHEFRIGLTIIGEVEDENGWRLLRRIETRAAAASFPVRILTGISRRDVFLEYEKSDLFVLASRDEPASVSNLEAMSAGLPVITSSTNKTSCYTQDNGLVFKSDSLDSLISSIRAIVGDLAKLRILGRRSQELVKLHHSPEIIARALIEGPPMRSQPRQAHD